MSTARSYWDGRHKWGPVLQEGATLKSTCGACGRTDSYETLIPQRFIAELIRFNQQPNPLRSLAR